VITAFRVEGEAPSKEGLASMLTQAAYNFIQDTGHHQDGEWECTDDVSVKMDKGYKGRMKFVFHRHGDT